MGKVAVQCLVAQIESLPKPDPQKIILTAKWFEK
jgi:hypothetical protein